MVAPSGVTDLSPLAAELMSRRESLLSAIRILIVDSQDSRLFCQLKNGLGYTSMIHDSIYTNLDTVKLYVTNLYNQFNGNAAGPSVSPQTDRGMQNTNKLKINGEMKIQSR